MLGKTLKALARSSIRNLALRNCSYSTVKMGNGRQINYTTFRSIKILVLVSFCTDTRDGENFNCR